MVAHPMLFTKGSWLASQEPFVNKVGWELMVARILDMERLCGPDFFIFIFIFYFFLKGSWETANQAYRYFLGVSTKHLLAAASGNMCWMATSIRYKLTTVAFWPHLLQIDNNRICKKVYIECKRLADKQNQDNIGQVKSRRFSWNCSA